MFRPLLALLPLLAVGLAVAEDATPARLVETRAGRTSRGATRVVFQTDRPVEFLAVELPTENGLEIHLLGIDTSTLPDRRAVSGGHIREISFRVSTSGLVARLTGGSARVTARTFTLPGPDRIVVDVYPEAGSSSSAEPKITSTPGVSSKSAPAPATKAPASGTDRAGSTRKSEPGPLDSASTAGADPRIDAEPMGEESDEDASIFEAPGANDGDPPGDSEFSDLLAWLQVLQSNVEALNFAEDEEQRAQYRRSLAFLLARRGLTHEAEKALVSSLSSDAYNRQTAVADSVHLAELRLRHGNTEGAAEAARTVDSGRATPFQKIRLANVLLETQFPALAADLLEDARRKTDGAARARATLLLARARWDQGNPTVALALAHELTGDPETPELVLAAALVLEADCLVATDRASDARPVYERAAHLTDSDEEASWIGLQLGNLARREGRHEDAIARYRETVEQWPDTFYASQAEWFLKVAQQLEALRQTEAARG